MQKDKLLATASLVIVAALAAPGAIALNDASQASVQCIANNGTFLPTGIEHALIDGLEISAPGQFQSTAFTESNFEAQYTIDNAGELTTYTSNDLGQTIWRADGAAPYSFAHLYERQGNYWGFADDTVTRWSIVYASNDDGSGCITLDDTDEGQPPMEFTEGALTPSSSAQNAVIPSATYGTCADANALLVCAVGDSSFCDPEGAQTAFDKMAAFVFSAYESFYKQTDVEMTVAWLKCYIGGDPFNYSDDHVQSFEAREYHQPASEMNMMLRFTADHSGVSGAYWCHDNWGYVGFNPAVETDTDLVANTVLHELGHGFGASHESGNVGGNCGFGADHADELIPSVVHTLPISLTATYSIMYGQSVGNDDKQRVFTDGGNVNYDSARKNTCVIGQEARNKGWTGAVRCVIL